MEPSSESNTIVLDGNSLTVDMLMSINQHTQIKLSASAWKRVGASRKVVDDIVNNGQVKYGINTGFGNFAEVVISPDRLRELQENLIRSHAAGVGEPLTLERTKRLLCLRINVLAKGYSGVSEKTLQQIIDAFNAHCISWVPQQGTLGASGDLAPLAHLALGMMGEGNMWNPKSCKYEDAGKVLKENGLMPLELGPKEGLALINGTQMIAALGAEAIARSQIVARAADVICALSLEALEGTVTAYSEAIHAIRPHKGQIRSASNMRHILHSKTYPSNITQGHKDCFRVQDAYSLRCAPQVHGVAYDTIEFVKGIIETEMNSATDNPMVFAESGKILSGGNFHGEFPSKALDYLAIGIHELASISERRVERLVNSTLSGLPAFLVKDGGLNSGFMIAHCTAAALVSENKTLAHPASVDSIPTSAEKEDHVSMGGWAARKCLQLIENVENVLAIELLAACQGLDLRMPLLTTAPLQAVHAAIRTKVAPWDKDRYFHPDLVAAAEMIRDNKLVTITEPFLTDKQIEFDNDSDDNESKPHQH